MISVAETGQGGGWLNIRRQAVPKMDAATGNERRPTVARRYAGTHDTSSIPSLTNFYFQGILDRFLELHNPASFRRTHYELAWKIKLNFPWHTINIYSGANLKFIWQQHYRESILCVFLEWWLPFDRCPTEPVAGFGGPKEESIERKRKERSGGKGAVGSG